MRSGGCAAIRDTDLTAQTVDLTVPAHCIAGANDLATPPALVKTIAGIIKGAGFEMIGNCGHLPSIEQPRATAIRKLHEALS
jgi:pimeloyl-ACP methyl ester carboxylesterase